MVDRDFGEHVFVWQIENFGENNACNDLRTPVTIAEGLDSSQWTLAISLKTITDPQHIGVFLHRCQSDDGPNRLTLWVEFCLIDKNGCEQCHGQLLKQTFQRNGKYGLERFLHLDTLSGRRLELMPNGILTMKCRAWKWRRNSLYPVTRSFAHTQIAVEESSFTWTIRHSRKTPPSGKRVIRIDSDSVKNCFVLECESVDEVENATSIRLAVVPKKPPDTSVWMSAKVTALTGQEEPLVRVNSTHLFEPRNGDTWQFPSLVLINSMRHPKDGNRVTLYCEFMISTVLLRAQKNETSCDTFELDYHTLRKDLRSYYQKTAWCPNISTEDRVTNADIMLRTLGGNFWAHKIILIARSPVFREILDEFDIQKKLWLQQTFGDTPIRKCKITVFREGIKVRLFHGQDIVEISDITAKTLSQVLECMYTDDVNPGNEMDALLLLRASTRFQFRTLQRKSRDYLKSMFTLVSLKQILSFKDCFEDVELRQYFLSFIRKNRYSILSSEEWAGFSEENEAIAMEILDSL